MAGMKTIVSLASCLPPRESPRHTPVGSGHVESRYRFSAGADLVLRPGEIVGLVGENGSGKSTLMKILVGSIDRDGGTITKSGSVGYCPQDPILYERLSCDEHFGLFGKAYGMTAADIDSAREDIYETLGFAEWRDSRVEELSGGTRAKLNLGLALLPDPELLLLDEPYAGFDWDTYQRFWQLTQQTARRRTESADNQPLHHRRRPIRPDL